jgi:hypothetical protein
MWTALITLVVVVLCVSVASAWAAAVRSAVLRRKFEALGVLPGRTLQEVLRHAGEPNHRRAMADGREVLEWRRINFRVALVFDGQVCASVAYDAGG